jgi:hypothetical protein
LARLAEYRSWAKKETKLEGLMGVSGEESRCVSDYRECRAHSLFIGSGQAEKADDLLVARRQKHKGMHW